MRWCAAHNLCIKGGRGWWSYGEAPMRWCTARHPCIKGRVSQNHMCTPYMTVCMVISLLKMPYLHRIYVRVYGFGQPYSQGWGWCSYGEVPLTYQL